MAFLFSLRPTSMMYAFSVFQGLAYYGMIYIIPPLSPLKGHIKLLASIAFLALALFIFIRKSAKGEITLKPLPVAVKLIVLYFMWSGISFLWGNSEGFKFGSTDLKLFIFFLWLNLLCEFLTVLLLSYCAPVQEIAKSFLKGFRDGSVFLALVLLVFWIIDGSSVRLSSRADILQPIVAAMLFALGIFASAALFFRAERQNRKSLIKTLLWIFPLLLSMILTVGKTALLSLPLSFLTYVLLVPSSRRIKGMLIACFTLGLMAIVPFIIPTIQDTSYETLTTLTGRLEVWDMTSELIKERPYAGHGMGTLVPELNWNKETAGYTGQAHNLFINIWFQLGVVGVCIMLAFFLAFLLLAVLAYRKPETRKQAAFGVGIFLMLVFLTATMSGLVGFYLPVQYLVMTLLWMSPRWNNSSVNSHDLTHHSDTLLKG